jgi:transposase
MNRLLSESDSCSSPSILMTQNAMKFRRIKRHKMTAPEMESRRCKAMELIFKDGYRQSQVAKILGVSRAAVSKWVSQFFEDDIDGLKRVRRSAKSPVLAFFLEPLLQRLSAGATKLGYSDECWTTLRLQNLLNKMTGLSQNRTTVKRTMNRIGWEFDSKDKCWKVDPRKHAESLAFLKGRQWFHES